MLKPKTPDPRNDRDVWREEEEAKKGAEKAAGIVEDREEIIEGLERQLLVEATKLQDYRNKPGNVSKPATHTVKKIADLEAQIEFQKKQIESFPAPKVEGGKTRKKRNTRRLN